MDIPANTAYLFNLLDEHGVTDRQIKQKMIIMLKYYNPENRPSNTKYQEYLKSEHWLEVRGYALEEYPECHFCGDVEGLLVHHMNYDCLGVYLDMVSLGVRVSVMSGITLNGMLTGFMKRLDMLAIDI